MDFLLSAGKYNYSILLIYYNIAPFKTLSRKQINIYDTDLTSY